jgi:hypothetical protein
MAVVNAEERVWKVSLNCNGWKLSACSSSLAESRESCRLYSDVYIGYLCSHC